MSRRNKIASAKLIQRIQNAILSGQYRDTYHSAARRSSRSVTRLEMEYALLHGWHEKRKDKFNEIYETWDYSIRGKTIDLRNLRVVVSFDEDGMLVITVIDLDKDD